MQPTQITVSVSVKAPVQKVWDYFNEPAHITQWNAASPDWHSPKAENDLRVGGKFSNRMEAKDGSAGFDFSGVYDEVVPLDKIAYTMDDGRKAVVTFIAKGEETEVTTVFDAETENPIEIQKGGWQSILNNFKSYVESH